MTALLVAAGAAVGAPLRYLLGLRWDTDRLPWGILSANVVGSLGLGALVGLDSSDSTMALLGTGFCGGFTTYSAFAMGTWNGGPRRGAAYAMLTVTLALPACACGWWLAAALS